MSLVANMQTQDHVKPIHSGNDGHGGVHLCHKCGWPYSNPHPSSKIRRAHKKVCGTIGKYRLDNNAKDKTHVEGYDVARHPDDEFKTSSVGRTISKGSNSGVGSISEENMFMDAITEFSESPAVLPREASGGDIQRFYSMQKANEFEDTKLAEENPIAGEDSVTTTGLKNNHLQTVQIMVGEKDKMEAGTESHAHISGNPALVSPAVTPEIENAIDQSILQSSERSHELNVVSERVKEIKSSKVEPELRNSFTRTPKEMAGDEGKVAKNEHLTSISLEDEQDHIFDANLSNADINIFKSEVVEEFRSENSENKKDGGTEKKKPIASIGSISLEGATRDARETTSNADSLRSDLDGDGEYFTVIHNDGSKVSENDDINSNGNITLEGAIPNGTVVSDGPAAENVEEIESSDKNARGGERMVDSGTDATLKSHDHLNSISKDVDENVESSRITDGDKFIKHAVTVSGVESIVDSGSMADSLDANWGSFSDPIPTANIIASNHSRTLEGEGIRSMGPKSSTVNQLSENQVSEINQTEHNSEIHSSTEQHVPNKGDKGKGILVDENTPLKTLLGEATATSRAESPIHRNQSSSSTFAAQNDVIPSTNDESLAKGKTVINNSEHPEMETVQAEMEKEWNSPARYPVKKTRASWMPFFCCSSVNAR